MKVYVDELPKDCLDCPCYNGEYMKCKLIHCEHSVGYFNENELDYKNVPINQDFEELNCPLQPLSDYTKQVRKEACEELREWARKQIIYCGGKATETDILTANASNQVLDDLKEFLDQIQGE